MSDNAMLPCFKCGKELRNAFRQQDNQPSEGTEFRTYGHYGSTFWDSFNGEEIVINICDDCLKANTTAIARHKRFRVIMVEWPPLDESKILPVSVVGRQWVDREIVPWFDGPEDEDEVHIEPEEVGSLQGYSKVEWNSNVEETKRLVLEAWKEHDERL